MSSSDSPEPAAGTPEEADARHEGFLAENLIDFGSFELRTKILAGTAVVVLLAAAAFIAAVNAVGGRSVVSVAVSQYGVLGAATGAISPPVVVAVDIALAVVFIMFTTATMHSRDDFVFLAGPFAFGFFAVGFMRTPADWLVLGPPVVVLEFMCYRLWVSSGLERSKGEPERPLPAGAILLVVLCVAAFFGLGLWKLGYSQLTTLMILRVRIGVEWLLVPVLILVGTDFGEATDAVSVIIVEHLARPIAKVAIPWVVIAAGLAGLLIADAVVVSGRWFLFLLPFAALVTAYSAVVVRRSGLPAGAAKHPPRGVVIALGIVGAICLVPDAFNDHNSVVAVGWGWGGAFVLYAFPVSWYFLRRGSAAGGGSADGEPSMLPFVAVFAFAVLVGATFFVGHATRAPLQFSNLLAVVAGSFGVAVIAGLVWLLARRAPGPLLAEAARAMTRALIGIIGLLLLDHVFASAASVSDSTAAAQAVIVVLSLLWDFAMSGAITNGTGESFPRHTRVALYGAYVLAVTAAVLLLSPLRVGSAVQRQAFTPELFPRYGILILAMPILAGLALPAFVRASIKHGTAAEKERPASRKKRSPESQSGRRKLRTCGNSGLLGLGLSSCCSAEAGGRYTGSCSTSLTGPRIPWAGARGGARMASTHCPTP